MNAYLVFYIAAIVVTAAASLIGHILKKGAIVGISAFAGFICGMIFGNWAFGSDSGNGTYFIVVNGQKAAAGGMDFLSVIMSGLIVVMIQILFWLLFIEIPSLIRRSFKKKTENGIFPVPLRILCVFLGSSGILNIIIFIVNISNGKEYLLAAIYGSLLCAISAILAVKWIRIGKGGK